MFSALAGGRVEDVGHLLDGGAEINETDRDGRTPLYVASREGHAALAALLLDRGADVDKARQDGATPLLMASQDGYATIAELLLARSANFNSTMSGGSTPLQIARERGHKDVAWLIHGHIRAYMLDCFRATLPSELIELVAAFAFASY